MEAVGFLIGAALSIGVAAANSTPAATAPALLSQTGLYTDIAARSVAATNRAFSPQYPLWTDGATKRRWIRLPKGKTIDARQANAWVFPVGTRFWKEFAWDGKPVETRFLEKTASGWIFASYVWRADGSDADLAPASGVRNQAEIAPGVRHDIPGTADCRTCHEGLGRDVPLGFTALQLSPDIDPLAPHSELGERAASLSMLVKEGRIAHAPASWRTAPPRIEAPTARERAVLGYLHANCGSCHSDSDPSGGLSLQADGPEPSVRATAIDIKARFQQPGVAPGETRRIAAGHPEMSALVLRMASRNPLRQMPPVGSKIVDEQAVELVRAWIAHDLARPTDVQIADTRTTGKESQR